VLANNHTADWGFEGLRETLTTMTTAHIPFAGAGFNAAAAAAPAVFSLSNGRGRVLVFSAGHYSSGVPAEWRAKDDREGVNIIDVDDPNSSVPKLKKQIGKSGTISSFCVMRYILYIVYLGNGNG